MSKAYLFLAEGFEEVEALTTVDILRRGGVETVMVSITGSLTVTGRSFIKVVADELFSHEKKYNDGNAIILPGGAPGYVNLGNDKKLMDLIHIYNKEEKLLCAICAAPSVLGKEGLLNNVEAVCYPGMEDKLTGAIASDKTTVVCGNIITSKGVGTAIDFALEILKKLNGKEVAEKVKLSIVY